VLQTVNGSLRQRSLLGPGLAADKKVLSARGMGCPMDFVTIAVVGLAVVAYVVGSLTSSVETETELPHNYR
jgi:hypothetical protein